MENETIPMPQVSPEWDEATIQEYNEYLDWLEEATGEQELPEDFTF